VALRTTHGATRSAARVGLVLAMITFSFNNSIPHSCVLNCC
jgi:hypothetical protein